MNAIVKAILVGVAAIAASDFAVKQFAKAGSTETEHDMYRYGGAALGAYLAARFV